MAAGLKREHPESLRSMSGPCRTGEQQLYGAFTQPVRRKRDGRKRSVMGPEKPDLADAPRFLVTDALHGESGRMIEPWSYRWASAILQAFGKPVTGWASAQGRQEAAVNRHLRVCCVAQSSIHRAPASESPSERSAFAAGPLTYGQRCRARGREVRRSVLERLRQLFTAGKSGAAGLELLMPASVSQAAFVLKPLPFQVV